MDKTDPKIDAAIVAEQERVTLDGREVSTDGGVSWALVEPSREWRDRQTAAASEQAAREAADSTAKAKALALLAKVDGANTTLNQIKNRTSPTQAQVAGDVRTLANIVQQLVEAQSDVIRYLIREDS